MGILSGGVQLEPKLHTVRTFYCVVKDFQVHTRTRSDDTMTCTSVCVLLCASVQQPWRSWWPLQVKESTWTHHVAFILKKNYDSCSLGRKIVFVPPWRR